MLRVTSVSQDTNPDPELAELLGGYPPPDNQKAAPADTGNGFETVEEAANFGVEYTADLDELLGGAIAEDPLFSLRRKLIENGYRPIPCEGKKPVLGNWGQLHATVDDLRGWTAPNTGIVLGSNLVAVDIDVLDAHVSGELIELALNLGTGLPLVRAGKKPKTLLLYRTDTPVRKRKSTVFTDAQGQTGAVEILGDGQQFIAYGTHPDTGKPYQWLPETMSPVDIPLADLPLIDLDRLDTFMVEAEAILRATGWDYKGKPEAAPVEQHDDDDDLLDLLEPDHARIKTALTFIGSDDHDDWIRVGMALHHEYRGKESGREFWHEWSRGSDKYDPRDLNRRWKSFGDKAHSVTIASLYDLAKAGGWNKKAALPPSRLSFLSPDDCDNAPSRGYLIKGLIAPRDVGCIFGAPGAGKSLISPWLGYAVAQGREAFGMRTKAGEVFYVAAEDEHGMRGRVKALKAEHGNAEAFTLVGGVSDLLSPDSPDLKALKEAVEARKPALIFIDTLAMAFPGLEENSAEAMGRVVKAARDLTAWGAAVILIHHDTKAEGSTPRGHSLLNGALDMALHVQPRDESGVIRGKLTKNRNGSCDRDIAFSIGTVDMGVDEDGDTLTTAICRPLSGAAAVKGPKLSPSERAALDVLRDLENIDLNRCSVPEREWREACISGHLVSGAENPDSRRRTFDRACRTLAGHGLVVFNGDNVNTKKHHDYNGIIDDAFDE
ncbi:AAA family ATPase [Asticcacaulis tiandongensis]|uniref:AAA family ATPase n=1 Tax=Asticcacaulis tiandongensis TaxID=2565365 RepID=UPI00112E59D7|nr:AAA family ATPase [Asticcacaulis tiandongensis]